MAWCLNVRVWWLAAWLLMAGSLRAQPASPPPASSGVSLVAPAPSVPLAGPFTLAFRLRGAVLASHSDFPEIEGFRKAAGLTTTTTTRLLPSGRRSTELTVTQRYFPYTEGDYVVPAFSLTVNGQVLRSAGSRVHVGAANPPLDASAAPPGTGVGSLDQLLGKPKPKYFYEPPDAGQLALEADHSQVYVGQGVRVNLYFYLKPADQALLNFYDFTNQLTELLRQLRQPTTWEVAAPDPSPLPDTVRRAGGQVWLRFRLAGRTYYPLTKEALQFPALQLILTKFKLLKKPEPGDNERLAIYKTYTAPALRVAVRPLPPPGAALVGEYTLHEGISGTRFRTGEAFTYTFGVEGTGNAAALAPPPLRPHAGLAVYGPDVREEQLPDGRFRKSFRYRLVAQRPGLLAFDSLLALPFFNPVVARYDTLRPELRVAVSGGAGSLATASPTDDPFYDQALARADAQLQPLDVYQQVGRYAGWLLAALLGVAVVGWWRAR
ncbi:BatD family protein [Hymenobacter sp. BRD128]|uniref:BatD family protein n=1 Tax=Hymenobacter sp. BRD128 TaxID=2675878 RepID=UPI00156510C0|nr:BatD family protein [Hymenobacter sp. BRD128]QKG57649.1 BatD family protein [Hymenobacter sp. BRD128]